MGQLVCWGDSVEIAAVLLSFLRHNPQVRQLADPNPEVTTDNEPGVHLRVGVDLAAYDRVFTKIGINLCTFLLGLDLVRDTAFDRAVIYAKDGVGAVYKVPVITDALFGPPLPNYHVLMLWPAPGTATNHAIVFMAQLYGGPIERFRLAEFAQPIVSLNRSIVVHVDYQKDRLERLTLEEHVARVVAIYGDWTRKTSGPEAARWLWSGR